MNMQGYKQCVTDATTEGGTLLDHIYVKNIDYVQIQISPTFYSYHEAVIIHF